MVAIRSVRSIAQSRDYQDHLIHGSKTKRLPTFLVSPKKKSYSPTHIDKRPRSFFFLFPAPHLSTPPFLFSICSTKNNITTTPSTATKQKKTADLLVAGSLVQLPFPIFIYLILCYFFFRRFFLLLFLTKTLKTYFYT
ncbi:hypothetical protein K457DRAFT_783960 [Linnemannia elongata AG-77]|uniref:Transmembrane protein n=1 Tax=Linnemannia elongata AG-77 TaxID=1314771 RepID=A0A197JJ31_9FUNG|nr:hypothetical protein K457DRAFT_783960 [Linnemannia elongata AG-77]